MIKTIKLNTVIFVTVISIGLMYSATAQAIYVNFADYQGAQSGNSADITAGGISMSISSRPTRFNLSITESGLGVACTSRRGHGRGHWRGRGRCRGNSSSQIDAEWRESITITFNDGPVSLNDVFLSRLYRGERAIVSAGNVRTAVVGSSYWRGDVNVNLYGRKVSKITVWSRGRHSDYSLSGIDITSPVPEPGAALLFAAGIGVVAARRRR